VAASAVLYVRDLISMSAFYEMCFAMVPLDAADGFRTLASADWELSLVRVLPRSGADVAVSHPPRRRAESPVKLAFDVDDLDQAGSRVLTAGGWLEPADTVWEYRGRRHLDCLDPEGNVVQLRQRSGE
jgi:predicted enzyme related to lactoylglutathione lyase